MNYSSPAQDWTEKQLQDKQLAELKMHVKGGPCRCNTAYLVSVPCFIDASVLDSLASGGTNLTKSFPCFISPLRGNHTGMQESTSAQVFFISLTAFVDCHKTCRMNFYFALRWVWTNTAHAGKKEVEWWGQDASEYIPLEDVFAGIWWPYSATGSDFTGWHHWPVEKFFLLTIRRTSTWPD